jgi:DNA primase
MNRTIVEQIKERLPVNEVIGQYLKLEKSGNAFKAKCPFHNEKTPSFFVSPDRGGYYCFGCNAKGDIFTFVEQFEGLDFRGALKVLAERAGVQLTFDKKADGERDRLFEIMEAAALFFEDQFTKNKEVKEYVKKRGINDATRQEFRIGWAPEGWQSLIDHLRVKKYSDMLIEKAGLGKKTDDGKFYDRFRGRVMFPISDSSGRVIAFSGRILKDDGKSAKYLNSPDTPLYDKSLVLYGLDKAKSDIRRMNYTIMVEGQMDLVMSHQAGIKNTVASSGTALTDESFSESGAVSNLGLVRRLSPNVIIAFDSDSAGRKAAMRAAGIALSMGMDVKIADLVGGKDPADLVLHNPEDWKQALRAAKPIIEFELGNVMRDIPDPRKIGRGLRERVFPFLARIDSRMDQAHFVKMISDKTNISEAAVWDDLKKVKVEAAQVGGATPAGTTSTGRFGGREGGREPAATSAEVDGVSRKSSFPEPVVVIPMPITNRRRKERGYNQCELLTDQMEELEKTSGCSRFVVRKDVLFRAHHASRQTLKGRHERIESAKGIFEIKAGVVLPELLQSRVIVIDDVITTGSTMYEAIETLKKAGFSNVRAISLAH